MDKFVYKVLNNGKYESGEIESENEEEVASKLKEKGLEILSVKKKEEKKLISSKTSASFMKRFKKVKKVEKVFLYKNMATMLQAGLPLTEAIDLMRESVKNQKLAEVLGQLKYDIEGGNYISTSLSVYPDVFGISEIAMIKAGEVGGTLPQSFEGLFQDADSERRLMSDIKGALMYPTIILSILILVVLLMLLFVLPQLTGFFDQAGIEVPTITKIIMAGSKLLQKTFIYIAIAFIGGIIGFLVALKRSKRMKVIFDKILLKIPFVGRQFKYFYIHKFGRMLALLIKSGVPILQALDIVKTSLTHTGYAHAMQNIRERVKIGDKLSDLIAEYEDLFPAFVGRMLKVGDRTGNTSEALENVAEYYKDELQGTLDNLASLIEPVLMVALGAGVAFMAIAVLIPMYSIVSGINEMQK